MNTDKRFMVDDAGTLIDMHTRDTFDYVSDVVTLLNELSDENEQLQQRNKWLEEKIQRERTSFTKIHERWSKEAETKIKELADENKELKQENKELQDTIETICKDFEESHGMDIRNTDWFTAW